jgi:hypothetical protein
MEAVTTRSLIRTVAARWRRQYPDKRRDQLAALEALDPGTAAAEDVEAIVGNRSWTRTVCDECKREVGRTVRLGEEPAYESATAYVCRDYLVRALTLLDAAE